MKYLMNGLGMAVLCCTTAAMANDTALTQDELEARVAELGHFVGLTQRHEASLHDCILHTEVWETSQSEERETLWTIFEVDVRGLDIPEVDEKTNLRVLSVPSPTRPIVLAPIISKEPFFIEHEKAKSRSRPDKFRVIPTKSRDGVDYVYEYHLDGIIIFEGDTNPHRFNEIFEIILEYRQRFCEDLS